MDVANQIILIAAVLITLAIFSGMFFSRIGAPLLLVFLALGMLAGEDGPGGIVFQDFRIVYLLGSIALALILFDGGLRTKRDALKLSWAPSGMLATIGVAITAGITGTVAHFALALDWPEALLLGAIVGSTDAAAVFFLLTLKGLRLRPRVGATLEVESGLNDPMAIFLTSLMIALSVSGVQAANAANDPWPAIFALAWAFGWQLLGGLLFGLIGGQIILRLINRLNVLPSLNPILASALALLIYAVAQSVNASGFLAIFLIGVTLANMPHKATLELNRFSDGMAWLAQIAMFLFMGLLVTPTELLPVLGGSLAVAFALIFLARPIAVFLSLTPFGFAFKETAFVSWVGLRGAVPIFLGTIPVLAGVQNGELIFVVSFTVVLTSLVVQGWTIGVAAKLCDVELPPRPKAAPHAELDLPAGVGRTVVAYTVDPSSLTAQRRMSKLPLPPETEIMSVVRDGQIFTSQKADPLQARDLVFVVTSPSAFGHLDRLFGARANAQKNLLSSQIQPDFWLDPQARAGGIADLYGIPLSKEDRPKTVGEVVSHRAQKRLKTGEVIHIGTVGFVLERVEAGEIKKLGLALDPESWDQVFSRRLKSWWRELWGSSRG